ncbi:GRB2-related adapter protein-like [Mytilus trossulus]|uniref:GRB2-related adapter protein-like n=1 Tax=Mytilus trossulus TaxID=6551 RepID=UPI003003B633
MAEPFNENEAQTAFMCQFCDQQNVKWKCEDCGVYLCNACKEKIHPRLKSSDKHKIISIREIGKMPCFDDEPWYHGKMSREEALVLLQKYKYMGDGAFLVRESETSSGKYSLDVLVNGEPVHTRIFTKEESGRLRYFSRDDEMFDSLNEVIELLKRKKRKTKNGVSIKEFTLVEPIPKETICDK